MYNLPYLDQVTKEVNVNNKNLKDLELTDSKHISEEKKEKFWKGLATKRLFPTKNTTLSIKQDTQDNDDIKFKSPLKINTQSIKVSSSNMLSNKEKSSKDKSYNNEVKKQSTQTKSYFSNFQKSYTDLSINNFNKSISSDSTQAKDKDKSQGKKKIFENLEDDDDDSVDLLKAQKQDNSNSFLTFSYLNSKSLPVISGRKIQFNNQFELEQTLLEEQKYKNGYNNLKDSDRSIFGLKPKNFINKLKKRPTSINSTKLRLIMQLSTNFSNIPLSKIKQEIINCNNSITDSKLAEENSKPKTDNEENKISNLASTPLTINPGIESSSNISPLINSCSKIPLITPNECVDKTEIKYNSDLFFENMSEVKFLINKGLPIANQKIYKCDYCEAEFSNRFAKGGHMKYHHTGKSVRYQQKVEVRERNSFKRNILNNARKILLQKILNNELPESFKYHIELKKIKKQIIRERFKVGKNIRNSNKSK